MEFVHPIGAQSAAERLVQLCLAERHQSHGPRRCRLGGG
jgi:hypothetical protein